MRAKIFILLIFFLSLGFSQVERWVYRYNGPQNGNDFAKAIVQDNQGNLYIAGSDGDFIVISLTSDGEERWIYRYNGTANSDDGANSIIYGIDGNLYVCGYTTNTGRGKDVLVVSLTTNGEQRWIVEYNSEENGNDEAFSIAQSSIGDLCVVGCFNEGGSLQWLGALGISSTGELRWGAGAGREGSESNATKVILGADNHFYATGYVGMEFVIVALNLGITVYYFESEYGDASYSLTCDSNWHLYVCGSLLEDFTVMCCSLNEWLEEKWTYRYNGPGNGDDDAYDIVYGLDNNLYVAGKTIANNLFSDFTVISLKLNSQERWVYHYNGEADSNDEAYSIAYGRDGNIYVCGYSTNNNTAADFTVISLTSDGRERWVYSYNGSANGNDCAQSIIYGIEGNLYICGYTTNNQTNIDFTVISLEPLPAIEERKSISLHKLKINNFGREIEFIFNLSQSMKIPVSIYDPLGKKILSFDINGKEGVFSYKKDLSNMPPGIYLLRVEIDNKILNRKLIILK
ncbi:MAG: T9SS type A sorting domain-containing protein [candidate division WOR-3 bacterium]